MGHYIGILLYIYFIFTDEEQAGGSDIERDASRVTSLPPAPIALPYTCPVVQIACGLHHTVVLTQGGEVFTFGSNIYGQLGIGDVLLRGGPVSVRIPNLAQSVAAGSNHTVILTVHGEVYTFGNYQVIHYFIVWIVCLTNICI